MTELYQAGIKSYQRFWLCPQDKKKLRQIYDQDVNNLLVWHPKISPTKLSNLTNKELIALFKSYLKDYHLFWTAGNMPELTAYGSGFLLEKAIGKEYNEATSSALIRILSLPKKPSFHLQEQIELLNLGKIFWQKIELRQLLLKGNIQQLANTLKQKYPELNLKLKHHQQKYHWILNGYWGARYLQPENFLGELLDLIKQTTPQAVLKKFQTTRKKQQQEKEQAITKYQVSKEIIQLGRVVGESSAWQDERKAINLLANYYLDLFLKEFSQRLEVSQNDLSYLIPEELILVLEGKKSILKKILGRQQVCILEFTENKFMLLEKKKAKQILTKLEKPRTEIPEQFKGMVVSVEEKIVRGRVRILSDAKDSDKLKGGEILVAGMTSPEYITAIKQAKAIITDEGGLTCHAAIVSRELGKTCLVSTKIATKVLKDGDLVEVNANKGIVKKIR